MARVRCVTEMGMGVDVHGRDATKAAKRAVSDAIRHSSLGFVRMLGKTPHDMLVDVTIGVPNPEAIDAAAVAKELPYGTVTVTAVKGGLEIPAESGGDAITIADHFGAGLLAPAFQSLALDAGGLVIMEFVGNALLVQPRARLLHGVAILDAVDGDGHGAVPSRRTTCRRRG